MTTLPGHSEGSAAPPQSGGWTTPAASLLVFLCVLGLASAQGGYFATSWGWVSTILLWIVGVWLVVSGRTEAGKLDLVYITLLGLLAGWIALSIAWSAVPDDSLLEVQRVLVPVAGVAVVLALARSVNRAILFGALLAAIVLVSTYGLLTRLFPDRLGSYDPIATYRLSDPLGYWNGLGIFAVMGLLLALSTVNAGRRLWTRALAGAVTVPLATTLYFTYSRAAWIALGVGLAASLAVSPTRLRLIALSTVVALPSALGVLAASRSFALTHREIDLTDAVDDGRRLAIVIVALSAAAAGAIAASLIAERRLRVPTSARLAAGAIVWTGIAAVVVVALVRFGGPVSMTERAWNAFAAPPPAELRSPDLNSRLFSLSGNGRVEMWSAALDVYADNPLTGGGAGTFERFWQGRADATQRVRDAHGLYVETLAELGPLGLALLVAALCVPIAAALRDRRSPIVPAALGAYVAFLAHAGVDWDWELAGLTLTASLIGAALVIGARRGQVGTLPGGARVSGAVAAATLSVVSVVGLLGNGALADARDAVERGDIQVALSQANRAEALMPWSPWPWITRGEAELAAGDKAAAAESFENAIGEDRGEWRAWLGLALATDGTAQGRAIARARTLYPQSTEIERTVRELQKQRRP